MTTTELDNLACDAVNTKSRHVDWSEGWPEKWEYIEPTGKLQCGSCFAEVYEDTFEGACPSCGAEDLAEYREEDGGPMMNYFYPIPDFGEYGPGSDKAARLLDEAHVALCLIRLNGGEYNEDEWGLALTGGGMDLSWQICEAFIVLGYLPPLFACELPDFAGHDYSTERSKRIVEACRRSARFAATQGNALFNRLNKLEDAATAAPERGSTDGDV